MEIVLKDYYKGIKQILISMNTTRNLNKQSFIIFRMGS